MDELDGQRQEPKNALAAAKLKEDLGLKKEHLLYFLHRFSEMDYADESCQKAAAAQFFCSVAAASYGCHSTTKGSRLAMQAGFLLL